MATNQKVAGSNPSRAPKIDKSRKRFVDFYFISALRSVSYDGSKSPISVYRYSKLLFPTNLKVFYYTFGELYLAEKRSKIIIDVRRQRHDAVHNSPNTEGR